MSLLQYIASLWHFNLYRTPQWLFPILMKSFHLLILTSCTTPERTRLRDFEHPEKYSYQGTLSTATATTNADPLSCFDGNIKPTDDQTPLPPQE